MCDGAGVAYTYDTYEELKKMYCMVSTTMEALESHREVNR